MYVLIVNLIVVLSLGMSQDEIQSNEDSVSQEFSGKTNYEPAGVKAESNEIRKKVKSNDKQETEEYTETTVKEENDDVKCEVCKLVFVSEEELSDHLKKRKIHQNAYECCACMNIFRTMFKLDIHIIAHTGEKRYECKLCEKKYKTSQTLRRHSLGHTDEKPFECELCGKKFKFHEYLRRHLLQHGKGEKSHKCELCERKFSTKTLLDFHLLRHKGERRHECDVCHKKFTLSATLKVHKKNIHRGTTYKI